MTTRASDRLPAELMLQIFGYINTVEQFHQCSLVNKRWNSLVDSVIFKRNIKLIDSSDARALFNYLSAHPEQKPVRHLTITPRYCSLKIFKDLVPLVVNEALETIEGSLDGYFIHRELFQHSISRKQDFKNLRMIPAAYNYNKDYDQVLYRLRGNLQEITLNFRRTFYAASMKWTSLYQLNQFTNLKSLVFNSYVHTIEHAEAILKKCYKLQELTIHLAAEIHPTRADKVNNWMIYTVKQHTTLKKLTVKIGRVYVPHLLDYLLYKYPNLETIIVENIPINEPWGLSTRSYPMRPSQILEVIDKIIKIPSIMFTCEVYSEECTTNLDGFVRLQERDNALLSGASHYYSVKSRSFGVNNMTRAVKHSTDFLYVNYNSSYSDHRRLESYF